MAGRTRTPSKDVERALIDAAEAVLIRDGLAGVTVRAVAAEAGVALMGVYNRFGGKDGLESELLVRGFERLRAEVAAPADADPIVRLRAASAGYRAFATKHPQHYLIMFHASAGRHFTNKAVQESASRAFGELVSHIRYAMARGAISESDSVELARQVWAALHGAVSLELNGALRSPDLGSSYTRLVDLILRGMQAHR
ncbi:TetR/AcrR family transcriptional regulator [Micromonospora sp. NPDC003944]